MGWWKCFADLLGGPALDQCFSPGQFFFSFEASSLAPRMPFAFAGFGMKLVEYLEIIRVSDRGSRRQLATMRRVSDDGNANRNLLASNMQIIARSLRAGWGCNWVNRAPTLPFHPSPCPNHSISCSYQTNITKISNDLRIFPNHHRHHEATIGRSFEECYFNENFNILSSLISL